MRDRNRLSGGSAAATALAAFAAIFLAAVVLGPLPAMAAAVVARIDKSEQRMRVYVNGAPAHVWRVSTARRGYWTPNGSFRPIRLSRVWYSHRYHMSPMPYSIFFLGGYAIHGTYETRNLGRPVSHGCIRLHPRNAATLFALVQRYGMANTRIVITP